MVKYVRYRYIGIRYDDENTPKRLLEIYRSLFGSIGMDRLYPKIIYNDLENRVFILRIQSKYLDELIYTVKHFKVNFDENCDVIDISSTLSTLKSRLNILFNRKD